MSEMAQKSITPRNGADYLASIKDDGRQVYFDGDVVKDVTTHSAFKGATKSLARLQSAAQQHAARTRRRFNHRAAVLREGFRQPNDRGRH